MKLLRAALPIVALAVLIGGATGACSGLQRKAAPGGGAAGPQLALPFIADDYSRAVAEARARKVPLFIEAWAPW